MSKGPVVSTARDSSGDHERPQEDGLDENIKIQLIVCPVPLCRLMYGVQSVVRICACGRKETKLPLLLSRNGQLSVSITSAYIAI